jgi:hypothetical protein
MKEETPLSKDDNGKKFKNEDMTFIEAAQLILKQNDNKPMTSKEIWDEIEEQELVQTTGSTPWATLNASILTYADNSKSLKKRKIKLFHIVSDNPAMFILINPENEVQSIEDTYEDDFSDMDQVKTFSKFPKPFDIESELTKAQSQSEDDVLSFKSFGKVPNFRAVQSQEEREGVKSPFIDAICILGSSGRGKSHTTNMILDSIPNLEHELIIPSASTTNLLAQFSPSSESGGYVESRLGKIIMKAHNNPQKNYVAIFDECHKSNIIEMINDELLQCISMKRNGGNRFISSEDEISKLYKGLKELRGNLLIPDNFGFIFLSSKPDVIISNEDFFNRVDIYVMTGKPDEKSIEDSFEYSDGKIKLKEPYFKYFGGKGKSDIDLIRSTFDEI